MWNTNRAPAVVRPRRRWFASLSLVVFSLVVPCFGAGKLSAEEEKGWRSWLPGGGEEETTLVEGTPALAEGAADEQAPWMVKSPFAKVSWPEIKMPKVEFRAPWQGAANGEGGWFSAPLNKVRESARGAVDKTRLAWNKTVDRMKFPFSGGGSPAEDISPQLASQSRELGFWERFLGPGESTNQTENSNSVVDMMAQEQGGETRR